MKESKFWIWFIPVFIVLCFGIYSLMNMSSKVKDNQEAKVEVSKDAKKLKEDYEKLNNESIVVKLPEDNYYVIANKNMIEQVFNTNGIIYLGEVSSYASRKNVSLLNEVLTSTTLSKIYYINMASADDDFMNYLKEKLNSNKLNAGDTYLIKDNEVINTIKADKIDDDKELSDEAKKSIQKEYQEKIMDLIEKCDENC